MYPDRIGVLSGDRLSVKVSPAYLEAEPDDGENFGRGFECDVDHSFVTVGGGSGRDSLTVTLEAGRTRLRVDGVDVVFDGFRLFATDFEGERRDVEDAKVDFEPGDGSKVWPDHIGDYHAVRDSTVADLIDAIDAGKVEPLPKRDD